MLNPKAHEIAAVLGGVLLGGSAWWPYGSVIGAALGVIAVYFRRREQRGHGIVISTDDYVEYSSARPAVTFIAPSYVDSISAVVPAAFDALAALRTRQDSALEVEPWRHAIAVGLETLFSGDTIPVNLEESDAFEAAQFTDPVDGRTFQMELFPRTALEPIVVLSLVGFR